ncbi:hypothetical protein Hamer_G002010, partial [Homarus americanus]
ICYKDGDKVWMYNPLRKKSQTPKLQSPWEGPYTVVERLSHVTSRIRGGRKAQPKVVHEGSEEQSPTTDEDQIGDPGKTQGRTDPGNLTMDQEEKHLSLLAELDVTGEGDHLDVIPDVVVPSGGL